MSEALARDAAFRGVEQDFVDICLSPGGLTTLFQPIVSLHTSTPAVLALEALTRGPAGTELESADALFDAARRHQLEPEVDRACVATALETVQEHGLTHSLFLNTHPETLRRDPGFPAFVMATARRCGISLGRITVELIERGRMQVDAPLRTGLRRLADHGLRVALDDVAGVPADHDILEQIEPAFLKVDGELLRAARRSGTDRERLDAIVRACLRLGTTVIAEGIEDAWDLEVAGGAGITLAQGYFVGRPIRAAAIADGWLASGAYVGPSL